MRDIYFMKELFGLSTKECIGIYFLISVVMIVLAIILGTKNKK